MKPLKLTEPHIFKGYWWVPDNPEKKVAGISKPFVKIPRHIYAIGVHFNKLLVTLHTQI